MSYISVDVDIDDVICGMNGKEKQELVDELYSDGYVPSPLNKYNDALSLACEKLKGQTWRLSREEEEFIINLSKRF